ncbi:MAG: SRPBCC domain-containing protein [Alphaproteobacteria bacterium]
MSEPTVRHATVVVERDLDAPPERVYGAWAHERGSWDVPNDDWVVAEVENELQPDGRQRTCFGPKGDPMFESSGRYMIVEDGRLLIMAGVMHERGRPVTATMTTVEVIPHSDGTRVIVTDQSAYFEGQTEDMREAGWRKIVERLDAYLRNDEA